MKIFIFLLLFIPIIGFSQDNLLYSVFPLREGKITYEKIIEVAGVKKDQLFNRAKAWALSSYNSQKDALQTEDKEEGILVYKGFFPQVYTSPAYLGITTSEKWNYWQIIKILTKDEKAKIIITDIVVKTDPMPPAKYSGYSFTIEEYNSYSDEMYAKYKGMKKYREKAKSNAIENFKKAHIHNTETITSIEDYLTGKKKSDLDF